MRAKIDNNNTILKIFHLACLDNWWLAWMDDGFSNLISNPACRVGNKAGESTCKFHEFRSFWQFFDTLLNFCCLHDLTTKKYISVAKLKFYSQIINVQLQFSILPLCMACPDWNIYDLEVIFAKKEKKSRKMTEGNKTPKFARC